MRRQTLAAMVATVAALTLVGPAAAPAGDDHHHPRRTFKAKLRGANEVAAVSSTGRGDVTLKIDDDAGTIDYELNYSSLEGTITTASHVHFGQRNVNGGVMFFMCGGGGRPDCTPTAGTFTGTVVAADIIGPTGQGIALGEFAEAVAAIRAGLAYANVHSNKHGGGEIRGQLH